MVKLKIIQFFSYGYLFLLIINFVAFSPHYIFAQDNNDSNNDSSQNDVSSDVSSNDNSSNDSSVDSSVAETTSDSTSSESTQDQFTQAENNAISAQNDLNQAQNVMDQLGSSNADLEQISSQQQVVDAAQQAFNQSIESLNNAYNEMFDQQAAAQSSGDAASDAGDRVDAALSDGKSMTEAVAAGLNGLTPDQVPPDIAGAVFGQIAADRGISPTEAGVAVAVEGARAGWSVDQVAGAAAIAAQTAGGNTTEMANAAMSGAQIAHGSAAEVVSAGADTISMAVGTYGGNALDSIPSLVSMATQVGLSPSDLGREISELTADASGKTGFTQSELHSALTEAGFSEDKIAQALGQVAEQVLTSGQAIAAAGVPQPAPAPAPAAAPAPEVQAPAPVAQQTNGSQTTAPDVSSFSRSSANSFDGQIDGKQVSVSYGGNDYDSPDGKDIKDTTQITVNVSGNKTDVQIDSQTLNGNTTTSISVNGAQVTTIDQHIDHQNFSSASQVQSFLNENSISVPGFTSK